MPPPKFFEIIVILCFEKRFSRQNSVIHLKSNILAPQNFGLATTLFESTLSRFTLKLKVSYAVPEVIWNLIQEKFNPQSIHNWNFRRLHTFHVQDKFAELLNNKSLQLEFSK